MILIIDNYDSFTYNIVQYFGQLGQEVKVVRNDEITLRDIETLNPTHICISPGPCTPTEAGISCSVIEHYAGKLPILGVCLGHQAIGQVFGGKVIRAPRLMHGKLSPVLHQGTGIFRGIESPVTVTRYHSLIVERESLPDCLMITAETAEGEIMGLQHKDYPIYGVQFHPESIMTQEGHTMFQNFLDQA